MRAGRVLGKDGGVFAFDAPYLGSLPGYGIKTEVLSITSTPTGQGYWILGKDGGVGFDGSSAQVHESTAALLRSCGTESAHRATK